MTGVERRLRWRRHKGWETFSPKQGWAVKDYTTQVEYSWSGTAWAASAYVDSAVVHKAGIETITALKTFTVGVNLGGTANLSAYDEGTWTPTATNLGGTGITYATKWTKIGNRVDFAVTISGTGLTGSAASTAITLPFVPSRMSTATVMNSSYLTVGGALLYPDGKAYLPTFTSTSLIIISGTIFLS